jgi:murein DD-endopeptidase MepM/ murein hydrolase activator NlpD
MYAMRFFILFLFVCTSIRAQTDYPKDYFSPPLDIPFRLSGSFGELRSNHFHSGLDFKTLQQEGLEVRAVSDGYVSRIKISPFGNGKAIYITHPNGYTSVYCHLQKGTGAIETYIKKTHYKEKAYEIEMFLKPDELLVKKGQTIALSGNTGSSEGPHLHFEFRDSKTEKVINPMLFGFDKDVKDNRKPSVSAVYVYPIDNNSVVNQSKRPLLLNLSKQKDGSYLANKVVANGKIGFGITVVDYDDVSGNKNGIYKLQTYLNGKSTFGYQLDTYSFDEMRYVNALIDYSKYKTTSQRVQKLFMVNPYKLSFIKSDESNGIVTVFPNLTSVYRIEVSDYMGNVTIISIPINYHLSPAIVSSEAAVSNYFLKVNKDNNFVKKNMSVFFPANTFYEDFDMNFDVRDGTLYLHDDTVPVHSNFTITIEDGNYTEGEKEKVFIADISKGGRLGYNTTSIKGDVFTAKVRSLGMYTLAMDKTNPIISIGKSIEGRWLSAQRTVQFSINDAGSGIKSYDGYLNGNWVLFEYDNKTGRITHDFGDGVVAEGVNDLKVVVTDNLGNSTIFETRFFRSQK